MSFVFASIAWCFLFIALKANKIRRAAQQQIDYDAIDKKLYELDPALAIELGYVPPKPEEPIKPLAIATGNYLTGVGGIGFGAGGLGGFSVRQSMNQMNQELFLRYKQQEFFLHQQRQMLNNAEKRLHKIEFEYRRFLD